MTDSSLEGETTVRRRPQWLNLSQLDETVLCCSAMFVICWVVGLIRISEIDIQNH